MCNWATLLFYYLGLKFVQYCYRAWCLNTKVARDWLAHLVCWVTHKKIWSLSFDTIQLALLLFFFPPVTLHTASSGRFPVYNKAVLKIEECPFFSPAVCCRTWTIVFICEHSSLFKFPFKFDRIRWFKLKANSHCKLPLLAQQMRFTTPVSDLNHLKANHTKQLLNP